MTGFRRRRKKNSGFTFVELMIALAILAVLATVSIPAVVRWLPNYKLKTAARDMYSHFQKARLQAARLNTELAVVFNSADNTYQIINGGPDGLYGSGGDDILMNTTPLEGYGNGVRFGSGAATQSADGVTAIGAEINWEYALGNFVLFNPKGLVFETGYVYITNEEGSCFAVGTPSLSGTIVQRRWYINGGWD